MDPVKKGRRFRDRPRTKVGIAIAKPPSLADTDKLADGRQMSTLNWRAAQWRSSA